MSDDDLTATTPLPDTDSVVGAGSIQPMRSHGQPADAAEPEAGSVDEAGSIQPMRSHHGDES